MALLSAVAMAFGGCARGGDGNSWSRSPARFERFDSLLRLRFGESPDPSPFALLDTLARTLDTLRLADSSFERKVAAVAAVLAGPGGVEAVLRPSDTDLVPSLSFARHRGGCTSLSLAWIVLGRKAGLALEPVLLPGHMALRDTSGRFVEPLRGIERAAIFYDSAFQLARRPAYAKLVPHRRGLEVALAVHGGLLAWKAGDRSEALDAFRAAVVLAPGLPEAEGNLGLLHEALGSSDSARIHLRIAVAGDSLNQAAWERWMRLEQKRVVFGS
jgi:tetratricopeptide (TPR) repeat protein